MTTTTATSASSLKRSSENTSNILVENTKKIKCNNESDDNDCDNNTDNGEFKRRKMTKCAVLMMYSGLGYFGMQRNHGFETIEGVLFSTLKSAEVISEDEFHQTGRLAFQRASKTDKNVSALGQVCSLKLPIDRIVNLTSELNELLPPEIRILDVIRSTKSFNAKNQADNRSYQYICPSFSFAPSTVNVGNESEALAYRIDEKQIQLLNELLKRFVGTNNYHNFTSGRKPTDKSCRRYLLALECSFVMDYEEMQFVVITIRGQSFMLHQIRKMIGLVIAICRGNATEEVFDYVFTPLKADIPRAPGLGLLLLSVNFDFYNSKFQSDGIHKPIVWDSYKDLIGSFREEFVMRHIYNTEKAEQSMLRWIDTLPLHTFGPRDEHRNLLPVPVPATTISQSLPTSSPQPLPPTPPSPFDDPTSVSEEPSG